MLSLFFPSWKFFDKVEHTLDIWVRLNPDGAWSPLYPRQILWSWKHLVLNPQANWIHFLRTSAERLLQNTEDPICYGHLTNLVRKSLGKTTVQFQFKIVMTPTRTSSRPEDLLVSEWHEV